MKVRKEFDIVASQICLNCILRDISTEYKFEPPYYDVSYRCIESDIVESQKILNHILMD